MRCQSLQEFNMLGTNLPTCEFFSSPSIEHLSKPMKVDIEETLVDK